MRLCKNIGWSTLVAAAAAVVMLFAAQGAMAVMTGSAHDFKAKTWNPSGEICNVCHVPHKTASTALLWNHVTTTAPAYTLYSSPSLNAVPGQPAAGSVSKLCLSCHDGTVAVDNFGGPTTGTTFVLPASNLLNGTTSLTDDHPISFTYDAALATADGGLVSPPVDGKSVVAGIPLYAAKLECGSCHDVHNNGVGTPAKLLRVSNAASALCLKCHIK